MTDSSAVEWTLGAAVVALATVAALAAAGGGAATGAPSATTVHESPANLTINPVDPADHQPGEPNASYQIFATGEDAVDQDIERLSYAVIRYPAGDVSSCTAFSTAVFGVDRGNDDPGTKTDESLVNNQKESGHTEHEIYVEFYDEGDLGGESTYLDRDDQIVAYDKDCYTNPSEPGWYQFTGKINGTAEDGSEIAVEVDSHYFYICDCADRSEAESTLGPPPSESGGSSGSTGGSSDDTSGGDGGADGGSTATATPAATDTPDSNDEATPTGTATPAERAGTSTPASTPTATRTATATDTPGSDGEREAATGTATAATDTATGDGPAATATGTRARDDAGGQRAAVGPGGTPTYADGPGFGAVVALLGLLGDALLTRRVS